MPTPISVGVKITLLTPDADLYRRLQKTLANHLIASDFEGSRLIICDVGGRKLALPPGLPENIPVLALVPQRTFDLARALYNAGASDVLARNVPPGTLRDAVEALISSGPRRAAAQRAPSAELIYLRQLSEWAREGADLPVLFQKIVDSVADMLSVDIVSLMLREEDPATRASLLRIQAARGLSEQIIRLARVQVGEGISGLVAARGEPLLVQDVEKANLGINTSNSRYLTKSLLSVPIRIQRDTIGVLNINNKTTGQPFDDTDLNLLVTLCNQAGLAIDNARAYDNLRRQTRHLEDLNTRLAHLSRAKSELIVNLSHELKTPLTAIQGYVDLLRAGLAEPGRYEEILRKVHERSLHIGHLADRMIGYFALESRLAEFHRERFPFGVLLWTCVEEMQTAARAAGVTLQLDATGLDRYALADRRYYRELVLALIDNAIKFNQRGGRVRVHGRTVEDVDPPLIEVFVEDTGRGVSDELRDLIFQEFKQTDDIMTAKPDGLGLGLAIARAIAEGHSCAVKLLETGPRGSTFAFTVPLVTAED